MITAMPTILFTDLDDTLFSTARKRTPTDEFTLASVLKDGASSGWQSPQQQAFLKLWQDNAHIIPVTARNHDAFSRVRLTFDSYAIINHGGVILDANGQPEPTWQAQQLQHSNNTTDWLQAQQTHLLAIAKQLNADIRIKINHDHDLNLYVLLKSNTDDEAMVQKIADSYQELHKNELQEVGYLHINANNLAVLPNWLAKAHAVNYLKNKLFSDQACLTIGCGDSLSDLGFMQACDFWIAPSASQISQQTAQFIHPPH